MAPVKRLEAANLCRHCDPKQFNFETTAELEDLTEFVGQPRAVAALEFGIGIRQTGYNIFALGPEGTGKLSFVTDLFKQEAQSKTTPSDWCYVNNFEHPYRPHAICLPPGMGNTFRDAIEQFIEGLGTALPAAFESKEYQTRRQVIIENYKEQQEKAFETLQQKAQAHELALLQTPTGIVLAPVQDGQVLSAAAVQKLPEEKQKALKEKINALQKDLGKILRQVPGWQREMQKKLRELNHDIARFATVEPIEELKETYAEFPKIQEYLDAAQIDIIENAGDFLNPEEENTDNGEQTPGIGKSVPSLRRYQVNVLVDHSHSRGAPVIYEDNPTYQNLIGRVEHVARMGALVTDFNLIKPGALHKANDGYLIIEARKILQQPYAWEGLKRALQACQIRVESAAQMFSAISTVTLDPEPVPLNVKVALIGDRQLYYMLWQLDPDFGELFKVTADFEEQIERNEASQMLYARLIGTLAKKKALHHFNREAIARIIDHSARMSGDAERLSVQMGTVTDLLEEADYWADKADHDFITGDDVQKAIKAKINRADRVRARMQEQILRGTVLIDTQGAKIGQINGLSVLKLGDFTFGKPTRITAQVRLGRGKVVDIEREVALGGPIHSKGVLILSGFLGGRYAEEMPLSLSASLVFEQSYGGVEGDSASSAELYALLSAIAQTPIKQSLAVTGSVNQQGQVQAIGGVNEKIEGFFNICKSRGFTGDQGVLIPASNVKNLMLQQDVVDAIAQGTFNIYAVETIDQGIEILTGVPAGKQDQEGHYPPGTINYLVQTRLEAWAKKWQAFSGTGRIEGEQG